MWYLLSLSVLPVFSSVSSATLRLPLWHDSGHSFMLRLRNKISVKRCFSLFFSGASRHAHICAGVWLSAGTWIFVRRRGALCFCIYGCVCVVRDPNDAFYSPLLPCQRLSHTPACSKSCWDRSFFSVGTGYSRWHRIDMGHVEVIILRLHMSPASYRNTRQHVQEAWAKHLAFLRALLPLA